MYWRNAHGLYINQIIRYLDFHIIYLLFAAIPGTLLFCEDWDNRFVRVSVVRCSKQKYAVSKVLACFLSAVSVVFFAESLLLLLFCVQFPLFDTINNTSLSIAEPVTSILLILLIEILSEGFCAGFLCVVALWVSTKIINAFVTLATPLLAYYLISTTSFAIKIPSEFNIAYLSKAYISINDNLSFSFLFTVLIFFLATSVFSIYFIKNCTRRIENG